MLLFSEGNSNPFTPPTEPARRLSLEFGVDVPPATAARIARWLRVDVFPQIGDAPIASIKPVAMRAMVDKVEARGVVDTTRRICKTCELVLMCRG